MKSIIFSGGNVDYTEFTARPIKADDFIICADSGLRHADYLGILPNVILGDFDSVDADMLQKYKDKGVEVVQYKMRKDQTDTEIAVKYAVAKKATSIVVCGATGTRLDHTLANLHILLIALNAGVHAEIHDAHNIIFLTSSVAVLTAEVGYSLSLIPLTTEVTGVTTTGLSYELDDETLRMGQSRGVSNVFVENTVTISVDTGVLIVIHSID